MTTIAEAIIQKHNPATGRPVAPHYAELYSTAVSVDTAMKQRSQELAVIRAIFRFIKQYS